MNRRARHQVAADQFGDNFAIFHAHWIVCIPGIQERTNDHRRCQFCIGVFRTTHWSSPAPPLFGLVLQQTLCASDEVLRNRHQTRLISFCRRCSENLYQLH